MGKAWWWRLLLLVWFGYVFAGQLKNWGDSNLFGWFNLCIHESGHVIFGHCGQFLAVAGGTITQLAAPFYGMWNFWRQRDFFAMALCLGWLSTNLFNVANYMADARTMTLQLVSLGGMGEPLHDWHYLFGQMGLLPYDRIIAVGVWGLAVVSMTACFAAGLWLIGQMIFTRN